RAMSEYCKSATRTIGHNPAITETRQMSCTVSRSKPPCSVSRNAHSNPAATSSRGISGDRSCPKPVPSCSLPSRSACLTRFLRMKKSDDQQPVIRALQLYVVVEMIDQLETMRRQKRNDGVQPLLQMLHRIDQAVQRCRVARGFFIARQHFAGYLALDLRELVRNFLVTFFSGGVESRIEMLERSFQLFERVAGRGPGFLQDGSQFWRNKSGCDVLPQHLLSVEEI